MRINTGTKIAALIRHHPDALEAIVALSPDFKKLRNPVLRRLMAGRTSIAMACRIGGCAPEHFFEKLRPLGFEPEAERIAEEAISEGNAPLPPFLEDADEADIVTLDVRAMLAGGSDPLKLIQQTVKGLQKGQVLKIVNTFEPTPLIHLLGKQGFKSYVQKVSKDQIETYFFKAEGAVQPQPELPAEQDDWMQQMSRFENRLQEIDVRHLEMPLPMMTILEALDHLPPGTALYVLHKRIPVFLLTELKDRRFDYRINQSGEGTVYLLIFRPED
jgi:uncharacterized protein (DUF2249 family)